MVVWFVVEFFKLEREVSPVACDGLEKPVTRDRANGRWYRMLRTGAASSVILFGLVLTMMPWWMRNYRLTESFIPTTLQTGAGLYDGLNPNADGSSDMRFVDHFIQLEPREQPPNDQRAFGTTFEQRVDNCMKHTAFSWAAKNPGRVAELAWIKFLRTWNVWPNEASLSGFPVKIVVCLTYVPVLFFAIWGACRTIRQGFLYMICWLPALYFTMLHMLFVGSIRYRQPAMLGLIVLAAGWWSIQSRKMSKKESREAK